ncbi:hypothetical protein diail_4613 [Diaporthe ilicicola]|nr:hypothetical protein diail_4613 [Diaporthe ilicicola]
MLLGFLGGICEVVLHGKIKQSNAEADSKLEDHGSRAMTDEAEFAKAEHGGGAEGPGGIADDGRYSWQPERMTTGLSDDSTLAGSDAGAAQAANPYGEQAAGADWDGATRGMEQTTGVAVHDQAHAGSQYVAWHGEDQLPPTPSRFVIDDVDSPGYEGIDDNANYSAYGGHLNPPPALPKNTYQHQDAGDQYWNEGVEGVSNAGSTHAHGTRAASDGYGGEQVMVPPAAYSGDGYSPAVMPDSADYLAEYRQSQLYLQQDDDWYTAAAASYGTGAGTAK